MKSNKLQNGLFVLLTAGLIGSTALGAMSMKQLKELQPKVTQVSELEEKLKQMEDDKKTKEDNVKIADNYEIKSTKHISDAYINGDDSKLADTDKETLKLAKRVLKKIIKDGMTDFEKEKAVYEWMTKNIKTDSGGMTVIPIISKGVDNPGGVLKDRKAVCVGYATTFRLFMEMMEIPCKVVHNTSAYHSWDLVQLDGEWYHTDIYSDSGSTNYSHFNMSDSMQANNSESWDMDFFPPATGTKYNMAYQKREELKDIYKIPARIRKMLKKKENIVGLTFKKELSETDMKAVVEMIYTVQSVINNSEKYENYNLTGSWMTVDGKSMYAAYMYEYKPEESEEPEVPKKETKKINNIIKKAFEGDEFNTSYIDNMDDYGYGG